MLIKFRKLHLNELLKDSHMMWEPWHIWRLVYWSDIFIKLDQLYKNPKCHFLIAMIHYWRHNEVHALHISNTMVIISECLQNSLQSKIVFIFDLEWKVSILSCDITYPMQMWISIIIESELRDLWKGSEQIFLNVSIIVSELFDIIPTLLNFLVHFSHLLVFELVFVYLL